jgi:3',5'-nucleoside bisphosphate phosphatase
MGGFLNLHHEKMIDLHIHSTFSDGLLTPRQVVETAARLGICAIAVTDHDDIRAYSEARAAGLETGVEIVPGIELSSGDNTAEVHLLGYYIDPQNEPLLQFPSQSRSHREQRARQILQRLGNLGMNIPFEILKHKAGEGALGRPHIADIMVEEGMVFSFQEAFNKYLGENRPGYVPKLKISSQDAIDLIHRAGGLAFLAHPGTGVEMDVIRKLIDSGLDGIETMHPRHLPTMIETYRELAFKYGLLETGGSDCHGGRRGELMLGTMTVPWEILEKIKMRHHYLQRVKTA